MLKGTLIGYPIVGVRVVLEDGASHAVDSSELAFRTACIYAFREAFANAKPTIREPIMEVEVNGPVEYQGVLISSLNRRKGLVSRSEAVEDYVYIQGKVPLSNMFGFSTDLRSATQGKGEFTMEYKKHEAVPASVQEELVEQYRKNKKIGA